jgi:prolyl-tRNA synthetase
MFPAASTIEADELARLALRAATQLDKIERHKPADVAAIERFIDALECLSSEETNGVGFSMSLGPRGSEMLSAAVHTATNHRVTTTQMLTTEIKKIVGDMRHSAEAGGTAIGLRSLKSFSLFIHDFVQKNKSSGGITERGVFDYDYSFAG